MGLRPGPHCLGLSHPDHLPRREGTPLLDAAFPAAACGSQRPAQMHTELWSPTEDAGLSSATAGALRAHTNPVIGLQPGAVVSRWRHGVWPGDRSAGPPSPQPDCGWREHAGTPTARRPQPRPAWGRSRGELDGRAWLGPRAGKVTGIGPLCGAGSGLMGSPAPYLDARPHVPPSSKSGRWVHSRSGTVSAKNRGEELPLLLLGRVWNELDEGTSKLGAAVL